jgi:hypothetical protein
MYYYYYYYGEHTRKVTININFQKQFGDKVFLSELTEFLDTINELHKRVLLVTQPEYQKQTDLKNTDKVSLISYHDIELVHICRENPFSAKLVFHLAAFSHAPYWAIWKILIEMCKRYGKNNSDLQNTINACMSEFERLFKSVKAIMLDNRVKTILGIPPDFADLDAFVADIKEHLNKILINKRTMIIYNKFCYSAIFITDCFATIDGITDLLDDKIVLIDNYRE